MAKNTETKAPEKVEKAEPKLKSEYVVCVTGFYAFKKMFRSGAKISGKQYKDVIPQWIKEGKIK